MNENDQYLMSQVGPLLGQGERVLFTATMRRQPGLLVQLFLIGGLLMFLLTKIYFVALTNRRMILIRSKMGFFSFSGAPKHMNLGVEDWDVRQIQKVTCSGFANNRSMTFHLADRGKQKLRISPWFKTISGTKDFFEQVPNLVASGQLANGQLAGGAAPQLPGQGYAPQHAAAQPQHAAYAAAQQPQHAAYAAQQPQHAAYAQQPQHAAYAAQQPQQAWGQQQQALSPGTHVVVTGQDGNRYPATIVGEQQGYYLCATQSGQHWFPAQYVARA